MRGFFTYIKTGTFMKIKTLALVIAAGAAAYTGASWYSGQQTKAWYEQSVAIINQQLNQSGVKDFTGLEIVEYQSGIFSTTAIIEIKEKLNFMGTKNSTFRFQDKIQHGPIVWNSDGLSLLLSNIEGELLKTDAVDIQELFDSAKSNIPITYNRTLQFDKQSKTKFSVAQLGLETDQSQFSGGALTVLANADLTETSGNGEFEYATYNKNVNDQFIIKDVTFNFTQSNKQKALDFKAGKFLLDSSRINFSFDDVDVQLKDSNLDIPNGAFYFNFLAKNMQVDKASFTEPLLMLDIKRNNDLVEFINRVKAGNILVNNYNSGLVDLTFKAKNIQYQLAQGLRKEGQNSQTSVLNALQLLKYNPAFSIDPLIWQNDNGKSTLVLDTNLKSLNLAALTDYSSAIEDSVPYLRIEFDLSRAQIRELTRLLEKDESPEYIDQLMAKYDQLIDLLSQEKLVIKHENSVSTQWELKAGSVRFNEQTMTLKEYLAFIETVGEKIRNLTHSVNSNPTE